MLPLPVEYDRLARWFPAATARADAIGVTREMLRRWESADARATRPRVRAQTARAVELVAEVAREVERLVGDPQGAGRWMLAPQPALRGARVVDLARCGRLDVVAQLLVRPVDDRPIRQFTSEAVRRGADQIRTPGAGPLRRERPRGGSKAEVLRRIGVDDALIGPG